MHGSTTLSKLIKKILDFFSKVLVFPLNSVKMLSNFLIGRLDSEIFRAEVAALTLAGSNLILNIFSLQSPFINNLIKVAASLFNNGSISVMSFTLSTKLIKFSLGSCLGFLQRSNLLL